MIIDNKLLANNSVEEDCTKKPVSFTERKRKYMRAVRVRDVKEKIEKLPQRLKDPEFRKEVANRLLDDDL